MKQARSPLGVLLLWVLIGSKSMAQTTLPRKELLHVLVDRQALTGVEIKEITMPAGQAAPKHKHPCPVVGYIASGSVLFQVEGEEPRLIRQGEAFYEPRDKVILHFDNASADKPLVFIAFYLKEDREELIELLK